MILVHIANHLMFLLVGTSGASSMGVLDTFLKFSVVTYRLLLNAIVDTTVEPGKDGRYLPLNAAEPSSDDLSLPVGITVHHH